MGTENHRNNGFTLVELLIVLSIVAMLAVIAVMYMRGQIFKGNDARRKADINRIKIAVEEYEKDHNCYPPPQLVVCTNGGKGLRPYIDKIPCDPNTNASYFYDYQNSVCPSWYRFYSSFQFSQDSAITPGIGPNNAFNYVSGSANAPAPSGSGGGGGNTPTPTPSGNNGGGTPSQYYGCRSGACVPIQWDATRPGPECDPSYQDANCYGQCGPPAVECVPWH